MLSAMLTVRQSIKNVPRPLIYVHNNHDYNVYIPNVKK